MNYTFKTIIEQQLSDTHTPVSLYYKLRDKFTNTFLLESSDYKSKENSYSYICVNPISSFVADREQVNINYPDGKTERFITSNTDVAQLLNNYRESFEEKQTRHGFVTNGLFGYTSYDAIPFFENITFKAPTYDIPLMQYHVFEYLIVFNHFNNELYLIHHALNEKDLTLEPLKTLINQRNITTFKFQPEDKEDSNFTDNDFLEKIHKGIAHCYRGDVFQVVLSRRYKKAFKGDEFNVYRALRSINPSPYLFYYDYGNFKVFGSSPEAQLIIKDDEAIINPIAGTFKRTGNQEEDLKLADELSKDPKENAEHIMLVDLARNDLSKNSSKVQVERYKEIEFYSHVIHLVSKVKSKLEGTYNPIKILGDTYPAGTLSGAPKHRAMEIIDENEPTSRGLYGGAIGFLGFNGEFNHAIFIRSFMSYENHLYFQAGCGVVAKSNPESELNEVTNKLGALRKAIDLAKTI